MTEINLESLDAFNELTPRSADSKLLHTSMVCIFEELQLSLSKIFENLKKSILDVQKVQGEKIDALKLENQQLKKKMEKIEDKLDSEDAYERRDSLIISGKKIPAYKNDENCEDLLFKALKDNLQFDLQPNDISIMHRLPKKSKPDQPDHRDIIVKFCRRNQRQALLEKARKKKPNELYVNEALTPLRTGIAYVLRRAKNEFLDIISGSSTFDGKNYVWVKPPNPRGNCVKLPRAPG